MYLKSECIWIIFILLTHAWILAEWSVEGFYWKIKKLKSDDKELINQHKAALATLAKKDDAEKEFTKAKCIGDKVIKSLKDEIQKFKEEVVKLKEEKHISENNLYLEKTR